MGRKYKGAPGLPSWWASRRDGWPYLSAWAVLLVLALAAAIALLQRLWG